MLAYRTYRTDRNFTKSNTVKDRMWPNTIIGSLLDDYVAGLRWCCGMYRAAYACHLDHEADIGSVGD